MGKGGIVFYFWGADATEKGSLGPNTVVNSNQKNLGIPAGSTALSVAELKDHAEVPALLREHTAPA